MDLIIIAALSENFVIGKNGKIPWYIPEDLQRFRKLTLGNRVIMGRKTYESLPEKFRPLPRRENIVLTTKLQTAENLVEKEEKNIKVVLDINISEELMLEGYLRDTMRNVQNLRKNAGLQVGEKINLVLQETPQNSQLLKKYQSELKDKVDALNVSLGNETKIEKV